MFRDLAAFLTALIRQWVALVVGAVITIALAIVPSAVGYQISPFVWRWTLELTVVVAAFLAWRQEYAGRTSLEVTRPRISLEVGLGSANQRMYSKSYEYGIRVHNYGALAEFSGTVAVVRSSNSLHPPRFDRAPFAWKSNEESRAKILHGADDFITLAEIDIPTGPTREGIPPKIYVDYYNDDEDKIDRLWESLSVFSPPEYVFVELAVAIFSEPPMVGGPQRLNIKVDQNVISGVREGA